MAGLSKYMKPSLQDITNEVLIKASEGDLESFEIIYRATAGFVYNVVYRIIYNRQDAEEVTQEVFLSIYHSLKNFRFRSSFKTWIYRIAVNYAINRYKKMARERDRKKEYYENLNPWQVFRESEIGSEDRAEVINLFLKALNPDQRACVVLRNIEGLSYRQIADTLKVNINTVRTRLKRARERLLAMRKEVVKDGL